MTLPNAFLKLAPNGTDCIRKTVDHIDAEILSDLICGR